MTPESCLAFARNRWMTARAYFIFLAFALLPVFILACGGAKPAGEGAAIGEQRSAVGDPLEALRRSCNAEPRQPEACARFVARVFTPAKMLPIEGEAFDLAVEISSAAHVACFEWPKAPPESDSARAAACFALGTALRDNQRLKNRSGADWTPFLAFQNACTLGNTAGCDAKDRESVRPPSAAVAEASTLTDKRVPDPIPDTKESDVEGANLRITNMNVDGLKLDDIACRLDGTAVGGILGGLVVGAGFKQRMKQLSACPKGGTIEARVRWSGRAGRMIDIKTTGNNAATNECVTRALAGATSTVTGTCAATLTLPATRSMNK